MCKNIMIAVVYAETKLYNYFLLKEVFDMQNIRG